jgi:transcription elongation factor GreA
MPICHAFDNEHPGGQGSQVMTERSSSPLTGHGLLRDTNLPVEGPAPWGRPPAGSGPGVFIVELPAAQPKVAIDPSAVAEWLSRAPDLLLDGKRPSVADMQSRLASFWLPEQTILFIGSSKKSIGARLAGIYRTPLGERRPQPAGYWLKTLRDIGRARIWWSPSDDPEEWEDALIDRFVKAAGALPYAVLDTPSGEHRAHGLANPLHDGGEPPAGKAKTGTRPSRGTVTKERAPRAPRAPRQAATPQAGTAAALAAAPTHLTVEGLIALQAELLELTAHRRPEVIARIRAARELGDLSENADYESARKEQSFLEGRVLQLEQMIKSAEIIGASGGAGSIVALGSTVVVETDRHGEETFAIVGSAEADAAAGKISYTSPIGRALIGRRAGETVQVQAPGGSMEFRIVEVR